MGNLYQEIQIEGNGTIDVHEDISYQADLVPLHSHIFYELLFVCSGNVQYLLDGQCYQLQKGDMILIPPGLAHRPVFSEELTEPYRRIAVWINADFWELVVSKYPDMEFAFGECRRLNRYLLRTPSATWSGLYTAFKAVLREFHEKKLNWELCMSTGTLTLMAHICRTYYFLNAAQPISGNDDLFSSVFEYINTHFTEKLSLDLISAHFLVSKSTISHLFQEKMGVSFYHCVTQRRLIGAKNSMLSGTPIQKVWELYGFGDYSLFYRAFKKEYGISPREFLKKNVSRH
ncbi:MAG: AraC family transcriptional regulator [Lachnospiraceae bacterium]|nr:AraC family transcriptional regulator [Lachnospiraceae bacterium]